MFLEQLCGLKSIDIFVDSETRNLRGNILGFYFLFLWKNGFLGFLEREKKRVFYNCLFKKMISYKIKIL
jgi:hypothetical protein